MGEVQEWNVCEYVYVRDGEERTRKEEEEETEKKAHHTEKTFFYSFLFGMLLVPFKNEELYVLYQINLMVKVKLSNDDWLGKQVVYKTAIRFYL